ncbi:MAG: 4a-hydroxytetrahydrobiopterin dehydratase [bacterium]
MPVISEQQLNEELKELPQWEFFNNTIHKTFTTMDFSSAVAFIVKIAIEAEKLDHHPDLFLHSWNKVKITLSTHSEDGVTGKDIELAAAIERMF